MNTAKYLLSVRGSKAVRSADIALDSITVLAGVNASGKSTLARMMHQIVNLAAQYPYLLEKAAWEPLKNWAGQIVILEDRIDRNRSNPLSAYGVMAKSHEFEERLGHGELEAVISDLDQYSRQVLDKCRGRMSDGDVKRALEAFAGALRIGDSFSTDVDKLLAIFCEKCEKAKAEYLQKLNARTYVVYNLATSMRYDIRWLTDAERVSFLESGEPVYSVHSQAPKGKLEPDYALKEIFGLRESFYIASPWVGIPQIANDGCLTIKYDDFPHYPPEHTTSEFVSLFSLIGGSVELDSSTGSPRWLFVRGSDGKKIALNDCATGIKALSILNILLARGHLNSETLLIIDEPEAHLHPQWVVEYARILVQIAKRLKVRMLLTSHNPDMVAALQEISAHEKLDGVRFYLAQESGQSGLYDYESLGMNVEPIFKAFNKAIDNLELYEVDSDDGVEV